MIYYIGYYNCNQIRKEQRSVSPASENKMKYVISALSKIAKDNVIVVSPAPTKLNKPVRGSQVKLFENVSLKTFSSVGGKNKFVRIFGYFMTDIGFCRYLFRNIRKDDHLIVYHSLRYTRLIAVIKRIKKCKLTLEVEEIYNDVLKRSERKRKQEIAYIGIADRYIFPTELLNQMLNKDNKPYAVAHGTYLSEFDLGEHFDDSKIHVLYAGTLDPRKGGAVAATVAEFLPGSYHVHILGFGSPTEVKHISDLVNHIQKKSQAIVTYDGQLHGEDYTRFVQKCGIGLSTQNPDADFNDTSFPSKILSYMSNGLRVVSVRIPAIEISAIGKYIYFYDRQVPQEIANAIMSVEFDDRYDSRHILKGLDQKFCDELIKLL